MASVAAQPPAAAAAAAAATAAPSSSSSPKPKRLLIPGWSSRQLVGEDEANVWVPTHGENFHVRVGPNYDRNKKKEPSGPTMYEPIALDRVRFGTRISPIGHLFERPKLSPHAEAFKHPTVPPLLIVNVQLPDSGGFFSSSKDATVHAVCFFEIGRELAEAFSRPEGLADDAPPAFKLWGEWCSRAFREPKFRGRFKIMGQVRGNFSDYGLPGMLQGFNGKPTLITNSGSVFRGPNNEYIEMDCNVYQFNFMARRTLSSIREKLATIDFEFGATIEGRGDEEQPERMLGAVRFKNLDFYGCDTLTEEAYEHLLREAPPPPEKGE